MWLLGKQPQVAVGGVGVGDMYTDRALLVQVQLYLDISSRCWGRLFPSAHASFLRF